MITIEQARLICEAHEIEQLLDSTEEVELLEENNPELLSAYVALHDMAFKADYETEETHL